MLIQDSPALPEALCEQDTLSSAQYWFNQGRQENVPNMTEKLFTGTKSINTCKQLNISCFENSVDPDQLASQKPADQDPHCFPLCL